MIIIKTSQPNFQSELLKITTRDPYPIHIESDVKEIISTVQSKGDQAIIQFAQKFDHATFHSAKEFKVSPQEIETAYHEVPKKTQKIIKATIRQIQEFARFSRPKSWKKKFRQGVILGEQFTPMDRIGAYIPGGTAPLVSSILHTVAIAKSAKVKEIVAVSPPRADATLCSEMLVAMNEAGATEIYKLGGVYAIAALAFGTSSIKKVEKIVGPGNAWVTAAKKLVYGHVSLDMVAGPSEVMIIADSANNPDWIACDLLSQLEHGGGNLAILATNEKSLIDQVSQRISIIGEKLSRQNAIQDGLKKGLIFIHTKNLDEACEIASQIAPEHLEIMCQNPTHYVSSIKAAGAIFLGSHTPEPVGDFVAGPSHVLPTAGSAKFFHGLTADAFYRRSSILQYADSALQSEFPMIAAFAQMESLDAHYLSALSRHFATPLQIPEGMSIFDLKPTPKK